MDRNEEEDSSMDNDSDDDQSTQSSSTSSSMQQLIYRYIHGDSSTENESHSVNEYSSDE